MATKKSGRSTGDEITDDEIKALLPKGYALRRRKGSLCIESEAHPGTTVFTIERDDVRGMGITLPPFIMDHLLALPGSNLQFVDDKKSFALAWLPALTSTLGMHQENYSHLKKLPQIVDRIVGHIEDDSSSEKLRGDLRAMLDWVFEYHDVVTRFTRDEAVRTAQAMLAIESMKRGKGGEHKDANSPHRRAKDEATKLWPKALRYGWSAERMAKALRGLGFVEKQGTVARWMTRLRKGEAI